MPKLARKILDMNKVKGSISHAQFNLKGYLVGNPVTDDVIEGNTQVGVV